MTYLFANCESEADAFSVELTVLLLDLSEQVEQLWLVLLFDAISIVLNYNFYELFIISTINFTTKLNEATWLWKFESIGE